MFHLDKQSKRTRLAIRFFVYGVMTLATVVLSSILFLFALGYRFDDTSLSFEQGGLMQFRSSPNNAEVHINGKKLRSTTPAKTTIPAGDHEVSMKLDGYREWHKNVTVAAGQLLWLNYTRFIPENITTSPVQGYDNLHDAVPSPNRRYIALQPSANRPALVIANISDERRPRLTPAVIPASAYTAKQGSKSNFSIIEWGLDSRYMLIRHTTKGVNEVLRFDRERPEETVNLTDVYGTIREVHFAGNSANVVYGIVGNNLISMDVSRESSERLVPRASSFVVYKSNVIGYVAAAEDSKEVEVGVYKNNLSTTVNSYPAGTKLKIALNNYYDHDYLAVARGKVVELYRDPTNTTTSLLRTFREYTIDQPSVEWLYFSNSGRMLVTQNQATFNTYDLELDEHYTHSFDTDKKVTERFRWLDDYYLWSDLDGTLRIIEFDGTNQHVISSVASGFNVTLSDNGKALFSIGRNSSTNQYELQRSNLEAN